MTGEPLSGDLVYPAPESSCSKNCASKFVTRNHNGRSQEVSVSGGEGGVYGKANEKSDGGIGRCDWFAPDGDACRRAKHCGGCDAVSCGEHVQPTPCAGRSD